MGMRFIRAFSDIVRSYLGGIRKVEIDTSNWLIFYSQSRLLLGRRRSGGPGLYRALGMGMRFMRASSDIVRRYLGGIRRVEC